MHETHLAITTVITLLLLASVAAMVTKWVKVPYTLLLVVVGLAISPIRVLPQVHVLPELIMLIFLPALLFEAAWNLKFDQLRLAAVPMLTLAIAGVAVSVGVIGLILHWGVGLTWPAALLVGSIVSATDPVAVLALFKKLKLPIQLATLVEGESLFNDGIAVVFFRIVLAVVVGAVGGSGGHIALLSVCQFGLVVFGGVAVGTVIGYGASRLTAYFDDHLLEITLTVISAYGSYLIAEALGVSAVIAVLTAGLILGNYGTQTSMKESTLVAVDAFWEYAAFLANSLVFLLIGMETRLSALAEHIGLILWAALAMLAARVIVVYGMISITNRFGPPISMRWRHVLVWGGLRGALSIALALSLPADVPGRAELIILVFGAVILSLLVQGLTIAPLIGWLGLASNSNPELSPFMPPDTTATEVNSESQGD